MSTRNCQGMDSVIKPLDTIPEDKKVRVQRTQSTFDPFEKPANQVKRVHSENNACINFKTSSTGKESPKVRRHSSPSSGKWEVGSSEGDQAAGRRRDTFHSYQGSFSVKRTKTC
ncbi:CDK14 isoform 7 [Pongo abelii]|uniref:CDK14 isoform 7 n=1 Tax=Pongo abelii TaxID=9601 RepID=A0A2J8WK44_PONAB|nr:CDK14 isoform 7 [Pongo abelii]